MEHGCCQEAKIVSFVFQWICEIMLMDMMDSVVVSEMGVLSAIDHT
jgi:hypothetical protein